MVLDTSVLLALLFVEESSPRLLHALDAAEVRLVSAATVVEAALVVLGRFGEAGNQRLDRLLHELAVTVVPVDERHLIFARDAATRFGKGRHAAALNYGDCFSYACAVAEQLPLLFVGRDFSQTDIDVVDW